MLSSFGWKKAYQTFFEKKIVLQALNFFLNNQIYGNLFI